MRVPECNFTGKQTKMILVWDCMWKTLIGLAVLDMNRSVTRCGITSTVYQESVFQASLCFIGKQIVYFLIQNWQS
jgi:hypothetical protein